MPKMMRHFLGLGTASTLGRSSICVMPALSQFIGDELGKEASVSKGKVEAHEFREKLRQMNKGKGAGKGDE